MPVLMTPQPSLTYRLVSYLLVFPIFRVLFRGCTFGNDNVPRQGAVVVVANHGSHLDPPLLGHALGRPVAFMAKAELFRIPLLGAIIRACGAYPVKRGASDREAIRMATARLGEGWAIGVFLDGTRQANGRVNAPMPGAALLAARSDAPLLPVAIINSHRPSDTGHIGGGDFDLGLAIALLVRERLDVILERQLVACPHSEVPHLAVVVFK